MKKHILLALCIGLSVVSASAQHYRGFFDFTTTIPVVNTKGYGFELLILGEPLLVAALLTVYN